MSTTDRLKELAEAAKNQTERCSANGDCCGCALCAFELNITPQDVLSLIAELASLKAQEPVCEVGSHWNGGFDVRGFASLAPSGTKLYLAAGAQTTDIDAIVSEIEAIDCYHHGDPSYEHCPHTIRERAANIVKAYAGKHLSAGAQSIPAGYQLVPVEPTHAMISAMATSAASDDEGKFPMLLDLIDFSGESKTHTVLKAAYKAMLAAAPKEQS